MKKFLFSLAALALAAGAFAQAPAAPAATGAAPAAAAKAPEGKGQRLNKFDTNKDGQLSRDEAKAAPRLAKNFDAIDTNKDGQLSKDELKTFRAARKEEHQAKRDAKAAGAKAAPAPAAK